ncbi:MAG: type 1 glutamine amidotransferase [Acetivibrionales bacterium]|jgi:CobQ-like glutamine amidotransferase family enzyme
MYELCICHLYPDLLNLYGDRGNIIAISRRCQWRDIEVKVDNISIGDPFNYEDYDIIFIGGGQDYEQAIIQDDLMNGKRQKIVEAVENGKVFLGICGGFQLLGKYYRTNDGKEIECLGAINVWTHGGDTRLIGNIIFEINFLKNHHGEKLRVVGFENHAGKTYLGEGVKPLGKVIKGFGNNGEDGFEGAVYKNTFCTYSHGSLLPKNPALTDHLIMLALLNKYPDFQGLTPLDDELENLAHASLIKRFTE